MYYWHQSELTSEPMIRIADDWDDEKMERVRVFSSLDETGALMMGGRPRQYEMTAMLGPLAGR